ncbi:hypothetical protein [Roseovarius sp. D0-M9]|uniref:hypothetical protein n=1 Tax=Roseovarius sp. D0-M9 TaxID=3127117 RepID=UPI00300FDA80
MHISENFNNLDDLARNAVRLGREVAEHASTLHVGGNAKDAAFVSRCLARLSERQPFVESDDGSLKAVQDILSKDIADEVVGSEDCFVATHFDELGQQGEMRRRPIYSDRGSALIKLHDLLQDFLSNRNAVFDQVAAHRTLLKLMSA